MHLPYLYPETEEWLWRKLRQLRVRLTAVESEIERYRRNNWAWTRLMDDRDRYIHMIYDLERILVGEARPVGKHEHL